METLDLDLPVIQTRFVKQFDGTLNSILSFEELNIVLNPTFSKHYFYVSGTTMENTITTKHTDGSNASWGYQSEEQENNSYLLATELRQFIMSFNPKKLEELVNFDVEEMRRFGKISSVRKRAGFIIDGEIKLVKGLQL